MTNADDQKQPEHPPQRTWQMWLIMRSRPLVLAIVFFVVLVVMLLTGEGQNVSQP